MRKTVRDRLTISDRQPVQAQPADPAGPPPPKADPPPLAQPAEAAAAPSIRQAVFGVGDIVRHRFLPFRGVVYDIDPEFQNTEEWWEAIPEAIRPHKDQPFYHLLAENEEASYVAYVSQQNLEADPSGEPVRHPAAAELFEAFEGTRYVLRRAFRH